MFHESVEFLKRVLDPEGLRQTLIDVGPWVPAFAAAIVFAETGLLIGFFLPGDSLLVAVGVVARKGGFSIELAAPCIALAAVVGDQVGYRLGRIAGKAVFSRPDGRFIKRRHYLEAHEYFVKNGPKSIVLARYIPVFRTFVPFMAGVGEMPYRSFVKWNALGGVIWVFSLLAVGYILGGTPWADKLHHIILIVVAVSFIPVVIGFMKRWSANRVKN